MNWNEYKNKLKDGFDRFTFDKKIINIIKESKNNNQTIFVAGNGGSASMADHYASDFCKGANRNWQDETRKRFRAICLSTNTAYLTAISNDTNYSESFRQQLINLSNPNDIVVLISSSGNSPNIVKAAEYCKENNLILIGITGFIGGKLKELADYSAHVDADTYEMIEDTHSVFGHFLAQHLREDY